MDNGNMNIKAKKSKTCSVPIEKEVRKVNNEDNEDILIISYKIKFSDSARFMQVDWQILLMILHKDFTKLNVKIVFWIWKR